MLQKDRASPDFFFRGAGVFAARGKKKAELTVIKVVAFATQLIYYFNRTTSVNIQIVYKSLTQRTEKP